jgi:hypothetical protein
LKTKKKNEKKYFDFLLKLAYFDLGQLPEISEFDEVSDPFISLLFEYSKFLAEFEPKYPFIKAQEKYNHLISDFFDRSPNDIIPRQDQFFLELQQHLKSQIERIAVADKNSTKNTGTPIISMQGYQKVYFDEETGTFKGRFHPVIKKDNPLAQLDIGEEKQILDLILSDLMADYGLRPDRFRRCERCSNIFYQYTANEKIYCTTRCSNAVRQSRFVAKIPLIE